MKHTLRGPLRSAALSCALVVCAGAAQPLQPLGAFEGRGDVGAVLHAGAVEYDPARASYTISGSGENMWAKADAFHFVWKKVSGDVTLSADIAFLGAGTNAHRKGVLMIRQSLDADSAYADAALHGDGLTSLQWRAEKGGITQEIQANVSAPGRLRLTKRGNHFYMSLGASGEKPQFAGGWTEIALKEPFYVGIGVCSHEKDVVEKVVFSNVDLAAAPTAEIRNPVFYSTLETMAIPSTDRRAVLVTRDRLEAPVYSPDGQFIYFSSSRSGSMQIWRIKPDGSGMEQVTDDGFINRFPQPSPDGKFVTFLSSSTATPTSNGPQPLEIRAVSLADRRIRSLGKLLGGSGSMASPAWSPDSRRLAFVSYQLLPANP